MRVIPQFGASSLFLIKKLFCFKNHFYNWRGAIVLIALASLSACGGGGSGGGDGNGGGTGNFRVSGTVSGLNSDQVVISNNGGPDTSSAGTFNFSGVPGDVGYDIRIIRNPFYKLCRTVNGSASNISSDVTDVSIICEPVPIAQACSGESDSDGDEVSDCQELNIYGTDPWDSDTDGDGRTDKVEIDDFDPSNDIAANNPRIADMAKFAIDLVSAPQIRLNFTTSSSTTVSTETEYSTAATEGISSEVGGETSRLLQLGHTTSASETTTVGVEVGASLEGPSAKASFERSLTIGFEKSSTQSSGSSISWSNNQITENTRAYTDSLTKSETVGNEFTDGTLSVVAEIRNNGRIDYNLQNLALTAVYSDPRDPFTVRPIGNLEFGSGGFPATDLPTTATRQLNFSTDIDLETAQLLLRRSYGIVIQPGTFSVLDINNQSPLLLETQVADNTATVAIDFGANGNGESKFRVAINNGDGSLSISALQAIADILNISVTQGVGQWAYPGSAATATPSGLLEVNGLAMSNVENRFWLVAHNRRVDPLSTSRTTDVYNLLLEAYDLNDIRLRAGDNLTLVYVGDMDRDGISDSIERLQGTNPDNADSDGDNLNDGLELYGWLTNFNTAPCNEGANLERVYSNPLESDSDNDGIADDVEKAACGNPSLDFTVNAGLDRVVAKSQGNLSLSATISGTTSGSESYVWRLLSGPDVFDDIGPTDQLEGRNPTFRAPDEVASLLFELTVSDQGGFVQTDQVLVQVVLDPLQATFIGNAGAGGGVLGSMQNPYTDIITAQNNNPDDDLYIMNRGTDYQLANPLTNDGVSMFGGYDTSWVRNASVSPTPITRNTSGNMEPVVIINEAPSEIWFSGFNVKSNNVSTNANNNIVAMRINPGTMQVGPVNITNNVLTGDNVYSGLTAAIPGSSYALMAANVSTLRIIDNELVAGTGGRGQNGVESSPGANGASPSACCSGAVGTAGGDGGGGGAGGGVPNIDGKQGTAGSSLTGGGANGIGDGAAGGAGGPPSAGTGNPGGTGGHGENGDDGSGGRVIWSDDPLASSDRYVPQNGAPGGKGQAGGGGGGGSGGEGALVVFGGTGGGGGEGGAGSLGAGGGAGGGASIALWLERDLDVIEITGNDITSAGAGNGGDNNLPGFIISSVQTAFVGSNGGLGVGGNPAPCGSIFCADGDTGGTGGRGGDGGVGGYSGTGAGGPSFGIFVGSGLTPNITDNTITSGAGGDAGIPAPAVQIGINIPVVGNVIISLPITGAVAGNGGDSYAIYDADPLETNPVLNGTNLLTNATGGSATLSRGGEPGSAGTTNWVP